MVLWTILFGIAYAQSPLFTSNQNQYFFFGLARASLPALRNDWLFSTTDLVPVFSWLVTIAVRLFHSPVIFYLAYFLIFALYLYSLYSICLKIFPALNESRGIFLFGFFVTLTHSAALRFLITRLVHPDWEYLIEGGVAGQRLLGDVFQPSVFGVFLLLSVSFFLQRRDIPAILSLAASALVHPTYLLSGAVLTLTYMIIRWRETAGYRHSIRLGLLALILVLPIVVYTALQFSGIPSEINAAGQAIVVDYRQPHHMIIGSWLDARVLVKLLLFGSALWVTRRRPIFPVLWITGAATIFLTTVQGVTQSNTLAMLFPWRFSVILVPLSTTILAAAIVQWLTTRTAFFRQKSLWVKTLSTAGLVVLAGVGAYKFAAAYQSRQQSSESALFAAVKAIPYEGQVYLIPLKMQDFRLETGMPIVVEYKAAPQSSQGVLEWYERVQEVDHFYSGLPWGEACQRLPELVQRYGVTHIIVPLAEGNHQSCLEEIAHTDEYGIYRPITP